MEMEPKTDTIGCRLCLAITNEYIKIHENSQSNLNISEILTKYFENGVSEKFLSFMYIQQNL